MPREVWVRIIGDGTAEDPFRPDVPAGVNYSNAQIPTDHGPLTETCRVVLDDDKAEVAEVEPSDRDFALIIATADAVIQREAQNSIYADRAAARAAYRRLVATWGELTAEQRTILADALVESVKYGLRAADAEEIAREHNLINAAAAGRR